MFRFIVKQGSGGKWRWELHWYNGIVAALSPVEGHETEDDARRVMTGAMIRLAEDFPQRRWWDSEKRFQERVRDFVRRRYDCQPHRLNKA